MHMVWTNKLPHWGWNWWLKIQSILWRWGVNASFLVCRPDYAMDHPDYTDIEDAKVHLEHLVTSEKGIIACGDDERYVHDVKICYLLWCQNNVMWLLKTSKESGSYWCLHKSELYVSFLYSNIWRPQHLKRISDYRHYLNDLDRNELGQFSTFGGETPLWKVTIIADYAHHPSEIRATLDAARQKYPERSTASVTTHVLLYNRSLQCYHLLTTYTFYAILLASVREEECFYRRLVRLKGGAKDTSW